MAIDRLTVQKITSAGLKVVTDSSLVVTDTFVFRNNGRTGLRVVNGATAVVVTFAVDRNLAGNEVPDLVVTVPATETWDIGPFPPSVYNDNEGDVQFTLDDISNVEIAAWEL